MNARSTLVWSLRRELWEHRSLYIAPLVAAGFEVLAFTAHIAKQAAPLQGLSQMDPAKRAFIVAMPYSFSASMILFITFIVALFYCLDALYAERRDRSILFWKSMPVSDRMTVLSKFVVPMAVLPAVAFCVALATQLLIFASSGVVLAAKGVDVGAVWSSLPLGEMTVVMAYGLVVHALWYAPIYGALLFVSAWAKKAPFLWATLPLFGVFLFERIAFDSSYVYSFLKYRVTGAITEGFVPGAGKSMVLSTAQLDPVRFVSSYGLWVGLALAVAFLAVAIRIRRSREPI
ncbi:hypothetical protein DSM104443_04041 [Usitatibacter rugosus]|uniref:ABC-2 type transport system permease protein n=1 Tax=Usitatibacter rugosus TaxID=2732067 RepID=A0A6M4H4U4_9PROT|nr:ABC transporter permease [Usitatibacter rugosus]QJR12947.1 hypothetical protein DSM104443_04041 [Usitatibacter rugosus]